MADMNLTQAEADALIAMEKHRADNEQHNFPMGGESLIVPLQSVDRREQFLLDISRGRIDLLRGKYQNRARQVVVLVRLDFGGPPHRARMTKKFPAHTCMCTGRASATSGRCLFQQNISPGPTTLWGTLEDFMRFCNITQPPHIERGLFT